TCSNPLYARMNNVNRLINLRLSVGSHQTMQTLADGILDRTERDFDRVLVVGNPEVSDRHVRAWKLAGVDAERIPISKKVPKSLDRRTCVDVCVSNIAQKTRLIEGLTRSGIRVLSVGPISNKYEITKRVLESGVSILDPMEHHPLLTKVVNLIAAGKIGSARILRLEALRHDRGLSDFSLFEGLVNGFTAANLLLKNANVKKVFANKIKTGYSIFYATLLTFDNGSTCQLVSGSSAKQGMLEFSINGPAGMIAFNESGVVDSPSGLELSDTMYSITSVEVLCRTFLDFARNGVSNSQDLTKYKVVNAIVESARQKKQISL
ncbi:MAG: hypothetical protein ACHQ1H_10000, partial [Nitrososphaerales archaeon]